MTTKIKINLFFRGIAACLFLMAFFAPDTEGKTDEMVVSSDSLPDSLKASILRHLSSTAKVEPVESQNNTKMGEMKALPPDSPLLRNIPEGLAKKPARSQVFAAYSTLPGTSEIFTSTLSLARDTKVNSRHCSLTIPNLCPPKTSAESFRA
ncbi:MAG: hypothetical protein EXS64_08220 [Candidatus Latescibacteria bacterium]|nr:hypothetical protein [Candidatus Latescibacterota bacterium]